MEYQEKYTIVDIFEMSFHRIPFPLYAIDADQKMSINSVSSSDFSNVNVDFLRTKQLINDFQNRLNVYSKIEEDENSMTLYYNGSKLILNYNDNVLNIIKPELIGKDLTQEELDDFLINLDNTPNKSNLGANAILSVSLAYLKACSNSKNLPLYKYLGKTYSLPRCMMNILNGGCHADNNVDFQEFMIMPNRNSIKEQLQIGSEVFHTLKKILKEKHLITSVGDEGGFAPNLKSNEEALDVICMAIEKAGYTLGKDVSIALDIAASSFYDNKTKKYKVNKKKLTSEKLMELYIKLIKKYPIISIEDPFDENDFTTFKKFTSLVDIQIVGDDLFTTSAVLLQKGIDEKMCNAILLKANQIGTITEMINTINLAKENNYKTIISHRSGETEDTFIADFAVGLNLGQIKTGSMSRGERICKYNRILRIEEELNN